MRKRNQGKGRLVLGITGGFGSGKSTVASFFRPYGVKIIDADKIARALIKPGTGIYRKVVAAFGRDILKKDNSIDRKKLSGVVFSNKILLKKLNKIIHPAVIRIIKEELRASTGKPAVLDAPLLIESGLGRAVDKLIVVTITREEQIERVRKKTGLSRQDILKRIRAQIPLRRKVRLADFVIDNNGTIGKTREQTEQIIRRLLWRS